MVLAIGIVSFSVLATIGLLSVATDTNKRSRDEAIATQLAANEFDRLRSLSATNFPVTPYTRFYDAGAVEVAENSAVYELAILFSPPGSTTAADLIVNAEVRYPANAANQTKVLFTALTNLPRP